MSGKRSRVASSTSAQSRWLERGLGEQGHRLLERGEAVDLVDRLDPVDGLGGHRHGAHRLLVALVAHVDDLVALAGADLDLVVDLGDQRAHRVDHVAAVGLGGGDDLGCRAVGRQHQRATRRARRSMSSTKTTPRSSEALHDPLVVDDLVVAVHGRLEGPDHPGQRLDGHLDAGAEALGAASSTTSTVRRAGSRPLGRGVHGAVIVGEATGGAPRSCPGSRRTGPRTAHPGSLERHVCTPRRQRRARVAGRAGRARSRATRSSPSTARCPATSSPTGC